MKIADFHGKTQAKTRVGGRVFEVNLGKVFASWDVPSNGIAIWPSQYFEGVCLVHERHPESVRVFPWLRAAGGVAGSAGSAGSAGVRGRVPICRPYVREFVFQPPASSS